MTVATSRLTKVHGALGAGETIASGYAFGGMTGDVLGAASELSVTAALVVLAAS